MAKSLSLLQILLLPQIDKHMPLHLRRKLRPDRPRPKNFEMLPFSGSLLPGQRVNVQVKFMPTEEVSRVLSAVGVGEAYILPGNLSVLR